MIAPAEPTATTRGGAATPIRALPALLVNQIAAGEVIERPASVMKELIDNALDAGATRITLELEGGGIELVRVTDDGRGVPLDDASLMLAPHATSKISAAEDLDRIATMGFRGEALASIVSVARVRVRSRARDAESAWSIDAEGERVGDPRPDAGPVGTCVSVRNLFFNTPARRKFLRTPATEQQRCLETAKDLALAHPGVSFRALCEGREAFDLPARDGPRERILDVLGAELESQLLDVRADRFDDARGAMLWGVVGLPSIARATTKAQKFFINGRPIRDRTIQHALQEAYRGLMPFDRKPAAVLLIEMAPDAVDVNVHPTKAEVRFRDSGVVHSAVLRAVREALRRADLTPSLDSAIGARAPWAGAPEAILPAPERALTNFDGAPGPGPAQAPGNPEDRVALSAAASRFAAEFGRFRPAGASPGLGFGAPAPAQTATTPRDDAQAAPADAAQGLLPAPRPSARTLQVHNSFVVTQDAQGLVIVDQHALHERVMFEAIMARLARRTPGDYPEATTGAGAGTGAALESQRYLTPLTLHATPERIELLEPLRPVLERLGIDARPLGPATLGVHSFPTLLLERGVDAGEFLADFLERAERDGVPEGEEGVIHEIVDMMACKAAIKAGDRMSEPELAALLDLREAVERASSCPHGRPTSIRLTLRELERRFGRG